MPHPEVSYRRQKAVLWAATGFGADGMATVGPPSEVRVRWNAVRRELTDAQGNTVIVTAEVVVNQRIKIGSAMWLGALEDWYGTGSAGDDDEVMQVVAYNETPDLKNRVARRQVSLSKYRDTKPPTT